MTSIFVINVVGSISVGAYIVVGEIAGEVSTVALKLGLQNLELVGKVKVLVEEDLTFDALGKGTGNVDLEAVVFT